MSEISNTMSLKSQVARPALHNESKAEKDKAEKVPMHKHTDIAIEYFLHAETNSNQQTIKDDAVAKSSQAVSDAAISELSGDLLKAQNLIEDAMSKPVFQNNPATVGAALAALSDNIQKLLKAVQNETDSEISQQHPKIPFGGGFVIDLISGTISFDISVLMKERSSQKSSDEFIKSLKNKKKSSIPLFKDVLKEIGKVPTELKLQKDVDSEKQQAASALKNILKHNSKLSNAHKKLDPEKALRLLY